MFIPSCLRRVAKDGETTDWPVAASWLASWLAPWTCKETAQKLFCSLAHITKDFCRGMKDSVLQSEQ